MRVVCAWEGGSPLNQQAAWPKIFPSLRGQGSGEWQSRGICRKSRGNSEVQTPKARKSFPIGYKAIKPRAGSASAPSTGPGVVAVPLVHISGGWGALWWIYCQKRVLLAPSLEKKFGSGRGPYKIGRQFARTLFERVEWVGGTAESKKLSDDKNV